MATFSYFGYLCGYLPMCGLDTQESILATKVSNLRNKSHLYSKMTTCVSNCPNFIAIGVPIGLYGQTNGQAESNIITKTSPCNEDPLTPHFYIVKLGFAGVYIIFLFLLENIDCGYSLEPPY